MRTLLMLAAAALAVASPCALAGEEEVVLDHWFAQFQKDKKSGWTYERRVRTTRGGETVFVTEMQAFMEVGPQGQALPNPVQSRSRFVENEAGTVLEYETVVDFGQLSQRRAGTVKGGTISFEDSEKKGTVAYPAGALGPVGLQAKLKAGLKPGAKVQALAFTALDPGKGNQVTWTVPQQTTLVDVLGYHAWLYEVERRDSSDMPEKVLVDGAGTRWGGALNLGLIGFLRTEEVVAKACICHDLAGAATVSNEIDPAAKTAVCCGPNTVYFSRVAKLREMVDHIYGRASLPINAERPHMFLKELSLHLDRLKKDIERRRAGLPDVKNLSLDDIRTNLTQGIRQYRDLASQMAAGSKKAFLAKLENLRGDLDGIKD